MKKLLLLLSCSFFFELHAQFSISRFPADYSMVPRNLHTNKGLVKFDFLIDGHLFPDSTVLKKYEDGLFVSALNLPYMRAGQVYHFEFADSIAAALHHYKYELYYRGALWKTAEQVCCGDFYILNGQSNAESIMRTESCSGDYNFFIRTYGNASESGYVREWTTATGDGNLNSKGHIGQLGIAIASSIMLKNKIPVTILNGAVGAKQIKYFLRDAGNKENQQTNYGRLLSRTREADVAEYIRAIIWYQGENDAYAGTGQQNYAEMMQSLLGSWKEDYKGLENIYMYQIKSGCVSSTAATGEIQQAQVDVASTGEKIRTISTTCIAMCPDNCHFNYFNGYRVLGEKAARLIGHYQYHASDTTGIFSPQVSGAIRKDPLRIDLPVKNAASLHIYENMKNDFYLNTSLRHPAEVQKSNDTIRLLFSQPVAQYEHLSYSEQSNNGNAAVSGSGSNGLLCFYGMNFDDGANAGVLSIGDTTDLFSFYSGQNVYIYSKPGTVRNAAYKLYTVDGTLLKEASFRIYNGMNNFSLDLKEGILYFLTLHIETRDGNVIRKMKITK